MSKARQALESRLGAAGDYAFMDQMPEDTAILLSRAVDDTLERESRALDTAVDDAVARLPGMLRGIARSLLS